MRALWLEDRRLSLREDLPLPEPPAGEALVRVHLVGVCNTDLELLQGYYPYTGVPGHEFVGTVEDTNAAGWRGRRVVGEISAVCGSCDTCLAGRPRHCERRSVLGIVGRDGAFATHLRLPVANLREVPASMPDEVAVFTEPTAAALEIQEQVGIGACDRVVVIGAGKLGQLVAQSLATTGCELHVVARSERARGLLRARGIRTSEAASLPRRRADVVVECTGNPEGLEIARAAVRPRGTIVLKSTYHGRASVDMAPFVVDEISLVGSRCGPFDPALEMLASGARRPERPRRGTLRASRRADGLRARRPARRAQSARGLPVTHPRQGEYDRVAGLAGRKVAAGDRAALVAAERVRQVDVVLLQHVDRPGVAAADVAARQASSGLTFFVRCRMASGTLGRPSGKRSPARRSGPERHEHEALGREQLRAQADGQWAHGCEPANALDRHDQNGPGRLELAADWLGLVALGDQPFGVRPSEGIGLAGGREQPSQPVPHSVRVAALTVLERSHDDAGAELAQTALL